MAVPRDVADLHLAPLALEIDERIEELAALSLEDLAGRVALDADGLDFDERMRSSGLLGAVTYLIDLHGWIVTWDPRGIRLGHGDHHLVLGTPETFAQYRSGVRTSTR